MYNILINKHLETPTNKLKRNKTIENITDNDWLRIYEMLFIISKDNKLQSFQSRINHFILGTNYLLNKKIPTFDNKCQFCKAEEETIEHIFWKTFGRLISIFRS